MRKAKPSMSRKDKIVNCDWLILRVRVTSSLYYEAGFLCETRQASVDAMACHRCTSKKSVLRVWLCLWIMHLKMWKFVFFQGQCTSWNQLTYLNPALCICGIRVKVCTRLHHFNCKIVKAPPLGALRPRAWSHRSLAMSHSKLFPKVGSPETYM